MDGDAPVYGDALPFPHWMDEYILADGGFCGQLHHCTIVKAGELGWTEDKWYNKRVARFRTRVETNSPTVRVQTCSFSQPITPKRLSMTSDTHVVCDATFFGHMADCRRPKLDSTRVR